jgi:hypothetical protein
MKLANLTSKYKIRKWNFRSFDAHEIQTDARAARCCILRVLLVVDRERWKGVLAA